MSQSLAKRIAKLEDRLRQLRARKDLKVVARDFGLREPAQEPVEGTYKLHACPAECGGRVRTGEDRCPTCNAQLAWPER